MSVFLRGALSAVDADVDTRRRALRVAARPPEADGFYVMETRSGALAGAAAASVVWAARWGHATKLAVLDFMRIRALVTTPFTAAQAWGFEANMADGYTASHTGGAA